MDKIVRAIFGVISTLLLGFLLTNGLIEFYNIAWGVGDWLGEFSLKWGLAFFAYIIFSLFVLILFSLAIWAPASLEKWKRKLVAFRQRIGIFRWPIVLILLFSVPLLFQYTPWGAVFIKPFLRLNVWVFIVFFAAVFISKSEEDLFMWKEIFIAVLLTGCTFTIISSLANVSSFPFSLGWSEGNRLWDYSVLFGRRIYNYSGEKPIEAYLDFGRQLIGGLPFLIPGVTIFQVRLWLGIVAFLPYLILGWVTFRFHSKTINWVLAGFWTFMFLRQGPIHPPLLVSAILVAIAWGQSLWLAVPLIGVAAYFAQASRFTWIFAPAIWAVMLEFNEELLGNKENNRKTWLRAFISGLAGLTGGWVLPWIIGIIQKNASSAVSVGQVTEAVSNQPLLWFRLLPNATYPSGILLGLLLAIIPLVVILVYWFASNPGSTTPLQRLALALGLLSFGVVGIIVSAKIGGGGDLHNMDMFLIGLVFTAAIAWKKRGREWIENMDLSPVWIKLTLVLLVAIPAYQPLVRLYPLAYGERLEWVARLTDVEETRFLGSLPEDDQVKSALETIQKEISIAQQHGEILFMDQRQLLTFGYIQDVVFVPEYEKKLLMDKALGSDFEFFEPFYRDLESQRFSLIVSEILNSQLKKNDYLFGEENNAWVEWVSEPILCYYQPSKTLNKVHVQLLTPRQEIQQDCPFPSLGSK